jgi:hypothetical protein
MTDITDLPTERPRRAKSGPSVSATALGEHLGLTRQRIAQLADEGVIARLDDGRFDQNRARLAYLAWLRSPERRAVKSEAASELERAKTRLVMLRVLEREGRLIELDEAVETTKAMVAVFRAGVEGLPAAIGGRDLGERRRVEVLCRRLLEQIADEGARRAIELGKPTKGSGSETDD